MSDWHGILHLDGWEGRTQQPCLVVGETPTRYRIRALPGGSLRLPKGRQGLVRILYPGTHLVPKHSVTLAGGVIPEGHPHTETP